MVEEEDEKTLVDMAQELRNNFWDTSPLPYEWRIQQLTQLEKMLEENRDAFIKAAQSHLGTKSKGVNWYMRMFMILRDIREMQNNLADLMKPTKLHMGFPYSLTWKSEEIAEPRGVCLIIAPWNFPIVLLLRPLIGAIAAGNATILKPSEVTFEVAALVKKLVPKYLDEKYIRVVTGGPTTVQTLIKQKLDFVFFTGGTGVGSKIMQGCAENVTECLLELGGKNPVFVGDDTDIRIAATRITQGRFNFNSGQVCLCPEYVFISEDKVQSFIETVAEKLQEWHITKDGASVLSDSDFYGTIVSDNHFQRLMKIRGEYIGESASDEGKSKVLLGNEEWLGTPNSETRFMPPMVVRCNLEDFDKEGIMQGEVFGPFLTIVPMKGSSDHWKNDAIDKVRRTLWKPLCAYVFSNDKIGFIKYITDRVSAGAFATNHVMGQAALPGVPFGGTGLSGFGHYGGTDSFKSFSHMKPISYRSAGMEWAEEGFYPPNSEEAESKLRSLIPALKKRNEAVQAAKVFGVVTALSLIVYKYRDNEYVKPVIDKAASLIPSKKK